MFVEIKKELDADYKNNLDKVKRAISSDIVIAKQYATDKRNEQHKNHEISDDELKEFTLNRVEKQFKQNLDKDITYLTRIYNSQPPESVTIKVNYSKKGNVNAEGIIKEPRKTSITYKSRVGGSGYDKTSTAIAEILNQSPSMLRILCQKKEESLRNNKSDFSSTAVTGHDNTPVIAYGAGYDVIPSYQDSIGIDALAKLFEAIGYELRQTSDTKTTTEYTITKKGKLS